MELNYEVIGIRIKKLRKARKLTQDKLSELADISPQHLSQIESGRTKLSLQALVNICNALNVTTDKILCDVVSASKTELDEDIAAVFGNCSNEEISLMLAAAESIKRTIRLKKLKFSKD